MLLNCLSRGVRVFHTIEICPKCIVMTPCHARPSVVISNFECFRRINSYGVVFHNFVRSFNSVLGPSVLAVNLVVSRRQIFNLALTEANPVREVFFAQSRVTSLSRVRLVSPHQHLCHHFGCSAPISVNPWVISLHSDVHIL